MPQPAALLLRVVALLLRAALALCAVPALLLRVVVRPLRSVTALHAAVLAVFLNFRVPYRWSSVMLPNMADFWRQTTVDGGRFLGLMLLVGGCHIPTLRLLPGQPVSWTHSPDATGPNDDPPQHPRR